MASRDEVVLCRAHIGHTHILKKDPIPQCEHCQCILAFCRILMECNHFARERKDIFGRRDAVKSFCAALYIVFYNLMNLYNFFVFKLYHEYLLSDTQIAGKSSLCGGSGFSLSLSEWSFLPYV